MSRRREKRNFLALPVRALGTDAGGNDVRHVVCTLDLSAKGARIIGLPEVQVGQEIILEHKKNRVRFQAVWVGEPGTPRQGQVGLFSLDPHKKLADIDEFIAGEYVDSWSPATLVPVEIAADRRQVQRYDCDRSVEYWTDGGSPIVGRLDNISLTGCFVNTRFPLPRRTRLQMTLSLYGIKISAKGEVRAAWNGEGMGIMFTSLDRDSEVRLKKAVQRLKQNNQSGDSGSPERGVNEHILELVRAWFDRNLTMSWDDFFDIQVRAKGNLVNVGPDRG
jgi:PilZ domain-containing protein